MSFIETPIFTKFITTEFIDNDYRKLQNELIKNPELGKIIKNSKGVRKLRWKIKGKGKRGGIRIIYYCDLPDTIYMMFAYKKTQQETLSPEQSRTIKQLMGKWDL